ncbi:hypothetical protein AQUCO_05100096v1 [Aquilegia coerulea]|uniref:Uncharacterized protein n=1 Tax=Aquilegia coerulea TaxID=218851 RepID=A0A2G5CJ43_AQUCA|nr:hypothetical protein AQUCO_05100096v1 [Aquilegia coerulea]
MPYHASLDPCLNPCHWRQRQEMYAVELEPCDALLLSNRSLCRARLKNGDTALSDAEACLMFKPEWPKAYYRAGAACIVLGALFVFLSSFELETFMVIFSNSSCCICHAIKRIY